MHSQLLLQELFSFFSGIINATTWSYVVNNMNAANITNTYYFEKVDGNVYKRENGVNTLIQQNAWHNYFKGTSSNAPFDGWNFSGTWFVWTLDYPRLYEYTSSAITYVLSGNFVSKAINLGSAKKFIELDFNALTPEGTDINFQLRTSPTEGGLSSAPWLGPDGTNATYYDTNGEGVSSVHDFNSWVQWKANLSTNDNLVTPSIYSVNIVTKSIGEFVLSKQSTAYNWISFTPTQDTNGGTINWFYSISNSPYNWISSNGNLAGSNNIWIKGVLIGSTDSSSPNVSAVSVNYTK